MIIITAAACGAVEEGGAEPSSSSHQEADNRTQEVQQLVSKYRNQSLEILARVEQNAQELQLYAAEEMQKLSTQLESKAELENQLRRMKETELSIKSLEDQLEEAKL